MVQTAERKQKIGLLGGTFDPVHNGHLAVADHVQQAIGLDSIWFIPAALPPHKAGHTDGRDISSFAHRLAMLNIATEQKSSFVVSDIEAKRSAPSYSIDTIKILISQNDKEKDLFFIIGADAFLEIDTWKQYKELPALVSFAIITRPGSPPDRVGEVINRNFIDYQYDAARELWSNPRNIGSFILLHMDPIPISSTEIRDKVRNREEISGLVPLPVKNYIKNQRLYVE